MFTIIPVVSTAVYSRWRIPIPTPSPLSKDRTRTRERILAAAKIAFASDGYAAANMRDIAAKAGISAALVVRYFGSKQQLFAEAVAEAFDLRQAFAGIDRAALGRAFVVPLFSDQREDDLMSMMLRAAVDPAINPLARQLAQERMLEPLAALIGGADAERRASLLLSLVTGIWLYRFLLPVAPLTSAADDETINRVAALIQSIIDAEDE
jgi:AcrR family transcriptional regulator